MDARVTTVVEWSSTEGLMRHDLPKGSALDCVGIGGAVGRVRGPGHVPYWLYADGTVGKTPSPQTKGSQS